MKLESTFVFEQGENNWWIASLLEIEDTCSQDKTIAEARENALDATRDLTLVAARLWINAINQLTNLYEIK
ncbi:MAG: hypothetical protein H7175_19845 [Burkholderiales bacterium]|nr:hypothetical protein [Anaerolineae bacterium]